MRRLRNEKAAGGMPSTYVQVNESTSGLHYQARSLEYLEIGDPDDIE
jgi:hypothetical protein